MRVRVASFEMAQREEHRDRCSRGILSAGLSSAVATQRESQRLELLSPLQEQRSFYPCSLQYQTYPEPLRRIDFAEGSAASQASGSVNSTNSAIAEISDEGVEFTNYFPAPQPPLMCR